MIRDIRTTYNIRFSEKKYHSFLDQLNEKYHHKIKFRVAETPVFIPKYLTHRLIEAGNDVTDLITKPEFRKLTEKSIPQEVYVPNEDEHTQFLVVDLGICKGTDGLLEPQLIEMQGFPSLYAFQEFLASQYCEHFFVPGNFTHYFNGFDSSGYRELLRRILVGNQDPENTILLEIEPERQSTSIDFYITKAEFGVDVVCISEIIREGNKLFYKKDGRKIPVHRIYNRVIFDEFLKRKDLQCQFHLTEEADVEWAGHPNWFYRISKFCLPYVKSRYAPETVFLHEMKQIPDDLENYVLKPLFSFAGEGVIVNVKPEDIRAVRNPENYLLQRKVAYEPVVMSPDGGVKCEIRLLYLWEKDHAVPVLCNNLVRLGKAEMMGVKYNRDKTWVGGSIAFFEND
jgi:hypothetical protein